MTFASPARLGLLALLQLSVACGGDPSDAAGSGGANGDGSFGTGGATGAGAGVGAGADTGAGAGSGATPGGGPTDGFAPTATEAAAAMGTGVNLGQMFENTQHPRTLAAASAKIDAYYDRGFRNLRVPVTWTEAVGGDTIADPATGVVNRAHERLAVIQSVVDYALSKEGMYVIINAHHEHALKTESRSAVLQQLWVDLADIFRARSRRLLFEVLNEPHKDDLTPMPAADLRLMTGLAYDAIRAVDAQRIVLIGGNQWFAANEIPAVWTSLDEVGGGTDPYVMATFHHYNPWTFCGDDQGDYADEWTAMQMGQPMDTMKNWADTVGGGMPVYIGEWGVGWGSRYSGMDCNNIRFWYESFVATEATARNQPTGLWDDGGWFKVFDHATNTYDNNLIDCIAGDCEWTGEERFNAGCD